MAKKYSRKGLTPVVKEKKGFRTRYFNYKGGDIVHARVEGYKKVKGELVPVKLKTMVVTDRNLKDLGCDTYHIHVLNEWSQTEKL